MKPITTALLLLAGLAGGASAQEPGAVVVPEAVQALAGCWEGSGTVMGKPVSIALDARPVALGAQFVVEVDSVAVADPADRYTAHLVFGGKTQTSTPSGPVNLTGYFADSFGGDFTAVGTGFARPGGFEIAYPYPDADFVNRWEVTAETVSWTISARDAAGAEGAFAVYDLARTDCTASK